MEIRYLNEAEKKDSRFLYEQCFPEDSKLFVDYYYKEKCRDNQIAAAVDAGNIISMIHANPFWVSFCGNRTRVHYLVAVATDVAYRRQGWMRRLLAQVLTDGYSRGEPFSFLMPADPAYYEPFGYRHWNSQTVWELPKRQTTEGAVPLERRDMGLLAAFSNRVLASRFDLYVLRDSAYYERLKKEQKSEAGDVMVVWESEIPGDRPRITGSFCYGFEDGIEVREPIFETGIKARKKPLMMGRVIHLERFIRGLHFSEPYDAVVRVRDDMIAENNGCFRIHIDTGGGTAVRAETYETAKAMDIAELGQILFDKLSIFINELV